MNKGYIAGLEDSSVEIFENQHQVLKAIYRSRCIPFERLPEHIIGTLVQYMLDDNVAMRSLRIDLGLTSINEQLKQYARCNFKCLDGIADMAANGEIHKEIHNCPNLLTCKGAFKICSPIKGPFGTLTKKETRLFFQVCKGMQDKEIALTSRTTISTVETQLKSIRYKIAINNRVEMILYAVENNISL